MAFLLQLFLDLRFNITYTSSKYVYCTLVSHVTCRSTQIKRFKDSSL